MFNVLIICGGQSAEHEVSLQSAVNIHGNMDRERYRPLLAAVTKDGKWVTGENLILNREDPERISINPDHREAAFSGQTFDGEKIDCVFPIIHGTGGEDGFLQGFLEILGLPYVGPGVLASALCMNKRKAKEVFMRHGLKTCKYVSVPNFIEWPKFKEVQADLGETVFVKPANQGSSIGVSRCRTLKEYSEAMSLAFRFDTEVIIEEAVVGREIEFAVMGNEQVAVSDVGGEIVSDDFYSYRAKYVDPSESRLVAPAELSNVELYAFRVFAEKSYQALNCQGMSRVDFFFCPNGEMLINEINTLPGFTKISMFPKLWELSGLNYSDLISELIRLAFARKANLLSLSRTR